MRAFWIILLAAVLGQSGPAQQEPLNGIAVIVNDAVITYEDVRAMVGPAMVLLERQYGDQPQLLRERKSKLRMDGTDQLVERQLILHEFKTAGYNLPESIIDDAIRDHIKRRFGDRVTLARSLKAEGVSIETYRQHTREEIIIEEMRRFHISKAELVISPQKIADYYQANKTNYSVADQVKLRMIVLNKAPSGDNEATRELAKEILAKIKEGAPFEEMASIYSEGSQRAVGGDWGWRERSILRKELAEVAFKLKKGEHSDVIDLPDFCFLLQVDDFRPAHVKPLLEVREEIEKNLLAKERSGFQEKWIKRLKDKSFVRYF